VDALDNMETRYIINQAVVESGVPFFHGAVFGFDGRAMTIIPGKSACLRCVCKRVLPEEKIPVIGVTPAVIGVIQANEVIKYITGLGELLTNRMLVYEGLISRFTELEITRDPECDHCGGLKE
jgi:molybdopterin-synthase adenylyltransferase